MSALAAIILLALVGAGLLVAGTFLLAGIGYALVLSGLLFLSAAALVSRGLTPNG
ncbi:MAG: hypothetical protein MK097_03140 [Dechloromonas sp.]|nr:hypothetical protein [Dechloromonas sp.]